MLQKISNLGKTLNRLEQKEISGGDIVIDLIPIEGGSDCSDGSSPTYRCINNFLVGYCSNGKKLGGIGKHCS